jgi:simple sugar transport system permease protein
VSPVASPAGAGSDSPRAGTARPATRLRAIALQVALLLGAMAVSGLVVLATGRDPVAALGALVSGAFGSSYGILNVLTKTCPLLLTGLAVLIAFRTGFWNIGAEGQFIVGAIVAGWIGTWPGVPGVVHLPFLFAGAFVAGAAWCGIAAWLRVRRGALEVISTIMLNFVALYVLSWLVHGPLIQASGAQPIGDPLVPSATLPRVFGPGYTLHAGIFLALAAVAAGSLLLRVTETGFHLRVVGHNPGAARWAGIRVERTLFAAAILSGGIAAVAGATEVSGVLGRLFDRVSPGYGFTAIAVALLARLSPWGLVPAALFFGALEAGSSRMQQEADVSWVLVLVIQGVVIVASVATGRIARGFSQGYSPGYSPGEGKG